MRLIQAQKWSTHWSANYVIPISDTFDLRAAALWYYRSEIFFDSSNTDIFTSQKRAVHDQAKSVSDGWHHVRFQHGDNGELCTTRSVWDADIRDTRLGHRGRRDGKLQLSLLLRLQPRRSGFAGRVARRDLRV
jgi:hypothetical protein